MKQSIIVICMVGMITAQERSLESIFPLPSYKKVIDTCMRIYSDLLILEEKSQRNDRTDEVVDLIVGRLVRMESYITQLVIDYHQARTVSLEELDYLARLIEYMEITAEPLVKERFPVFFNTWLKGLKEDLCAVISAIPVQ